MIGAGSRRMLITGGNSGIGLALAKNLARRHQVLLSGRKPANEIAHSLPEGVAYIEADQRNPLGSAQALRTGLDEQGWDSLDNAVLNAGTGFVAGKGVDAPEHVRQTLDVNLAAAIAQAHALYPLLEARKGTLTFVGSVAHRGSPAIPAYAASKAGLHGLARALRSEWNGRVAVQIVHPGPTRTDMHAKAGYDPGRMGALFLDPGDVARMMASAIAARRSPTTLSWLRYLAGGAFTGRRL